MNRAERRRQEREQKKANKTYNLNRDQIAELKSKAQEDAQKLAVDTAFTLMLAIPLVVLTGEGYWEKTAKKRLPKFIDEVLSLYDSWEKGVLTIEELREDLWKYGGVKLEPPKGTGRM